ncbi:hypothetical protein DGMP_32330 [Desulfomarina profundi]|uniref:Uncharacterized protein n=1 Tax=Desulfomarina profundi TaxID=2772557 RepID=A0A8D5JQK5_9BACT|nr:hypothetical protein [Desulfomarina profundi]BCL62540.1 hypothetical protein DGMP_32330 [Desulfomarina profundi]
MELLVIKDGESYFRFRDNTALPCNMAKASVFPLEQIEKVRKLVEKLHQEGKMEAIIMQLTIHEKIYQED